MKVYDFGLQALLRHSSRAFSKIEEKMRGEGSCYWPKEAEGGFRVLGFRV